jgi:hypothetical protein
MTGTVETQQSEQAEADAHSNRGFAQLQAKQLDEAVASYDKALALRPDCSWRSATGGCPARARPARRSARLPGKGGRAAAQRAGRPQQSRRRAVDLGRIDEAVASYDKAIALRPDYAHAYFYCSRALLLSGQFERGWQYYEWRKLLTDEPAGHRAFAKPCWLGEEDIRGKTILVHWEQGDGDTFQFCRYVPLLERTGARVIFAPQRRLRHLLRSVSASVQFSHVDDTELQFDFHCPLMSLPRALRTTLATIPNTTPYLAADPYRVEYWRRRASVGADSISALPAGQRGQDRRRTSFLAEFRGPPRCPACG